MPNFIHLMNTVVTRKGGKYYSIVYGYSLFCAGLMAALAGIIYYQVQNNEVDARIFVLSVVFIGIMLPFMNIIYFYLTRIPTVTMDIEKISLSEEVFYWRDLKDASFGQKLPPDLTWHRDFYGIVFTFRDGRTRYIIDGVYDNMQQVQQFIQGRVLGRAAEMEVSHTPVAKIEVKQQQFEKFAGNMLTTGQHLLTGFMLFVMAAATSDFDFPEAWLVFIFFFGPLWWLMNVWSSNYFKVSADLLVVKNHLSFRNTVIRLSDVKEMDFEMSGRGPGHLRVITKDFNDRKYLCTTLSLKTEMKLCDCLHRNGVSLRNWHPSYAE